MPYTAKPRNLMPCGGCSSAQVKCDITAPYNSNLCRRCADKGLSQCPPYKPRKTNEQRDESPTGTSPPVFQVMPAVQHASSAPRAVETRGNHYSSFATDPSMAFTDRTSSVKEAVQSQPLAEGNFCSTYVADIPAVVEEPTSRFSSACMAVENRAEHYVPFVSGNGIAMAGCGTSSALKAVDSRGNFCSPFAANYAMASADNTSGLYSVPQRLEPIPQGNFSQPFSADSTRYSDSTRTLCPTNTFDHIQPHTPYNSMPIPSTDATMTLNNFGFIPQYSTFSSSTTAMDQALWENYWARLFLWQVTEGQNRPAQRFSAQCVTATKLFE